MSSIVRKRSLSIESDQEPTKKRPRETDDLLNDLTAILAEIKSTPSTGEISADLLNSFRLLMLQIESLSSDQSNVEAKDMKDKSDEYLDAWFQELIAECLTEEEQGQEQEQEGDEDEDDIALALALQDEEDYCKEIEKEEICSKSLDDKDEREDVDIEIV